MINQHGSVSKLLLNGTEVNRQEAKRANWQVFVEGGDAVSFADPIYVIDVINTLHANAVSLTPELKRQMF